MWFPTVEQIVQMHDEIIERTGGEPGILHRGSIEAAIERARWGPFPTDGHLVERAALLMRGIVVDHPFVDGNKRTAFEVVETFCERNRHRLAVAQEEIVEISVEVARGSRSVQELAAWLQAREGND